MLDRNEERSATTNDSHGLHTRTLLVLALSCTAGCTDALAYLLLGAFTANMTGNTVILGLSIGQVESVAAQRAGIAIACFVVGVAGGALITRFGRGTGVWPTSVTIALAVETVVLGAFALAWQLDATPFLLLGASAAAMGLQSASVRCLDMPGVATTYITGTVTTLVAGLAGHHRPLGPPEKALKERVSTHRGPLLLSCVWAVYIGGALAGGLGQSLVGPATALLPVALVLGVVVAAAFRYRAR